MLTTFGVVSLARSAEIRTLESGTTPRTVDSMARGDSCLNVYCKVIIQIAFAPLASRAAITSEILHSFTVGGLFRASPRAPSVLINRFRALTYRLNIEKLHPILVV